MSKANFQTKSRGAFTLIEILVVLIIMGFLVALVAPKLAGVVEESVSVTNKTGLQRFSDSINQFLKAESTLPPAMTNLIRTDQVVPNVAPSSSELVFTTDHKEMNGVDPLSEEFANRMLPVAHALNAAEAKELSRMIGGAVLNLEAYAAAGDLADTPANRAKKPVETYVRSKVQSGLPVMMIGAGFDTNTSTPVDYATGARVTVNGSTVTVDESTPEAIAPAVGGVLGSGAAFPGGAKVYTRIGEAKNVLRIVMGVSNRNMLVVKGWLDESGISSAQKHNSNDFTYGGYSVILPRLQATADRFAADATITATDTNGGGGQGGPVALDAGVTFQAVKFDKNDAGDFILSARTPTTPSLLGGAIAGQTMKATTVVDPLGHNIGERGGWFGVKLTRGTGQDLDGDLFSL